MNKKELDKKIKEKCEELDLIEKKKKSNYKYWIMSGILIIFLIIFINLNNPNEEKKVEEKVKQLDKEAIQISNYTGGDTFEFFNSGEYKVSLLIMAIASFIVSVLFVRNLFRGGSYGFI